MAKTRQIRLFYTLTQKEVFPPDPVAMERKNAWIKQLQSTVDADWKPLMIEVTYRLFNPEIEQMQKFFNGPVLEYWAIQNFEIFKGPVSRMQHDQTRETLLSNTLGYDVQLIGRKERRRHSTGDFQDTQRWNDFLEKLRETEFEPQGYEMPDSKAFWEMVKEHGYEAAKRMAIEGLQSRLIKKLSTPGE